MSKEKVDPREYVTERIIKMVESGGLLPWCRPWDSTTGTPKNVHSDKNYRGGNIWLLLMSGHSRFLTYKQAAEHSGTVKKGESGWPVIFYKPFNVKDKFDPTKTKSVPFWKYYTVFGIDQFCAITNEDAEIAKANEERWNKFLESVTPKTNGKKIDPIKAATKLHKAYEKLGGPKVSHFGDKAFYRPSTDEIVLPDMNQFIDAECYHQTRFHEETHSSGAANRLDRKGITDAIMFGSHNYSYEELVAEMGSAMLAAECGIIREDDIKRSSSYVSNWLKSLRSDPKMLFKAGQEAQKATDFVLGRKAPVYNSEEVAA